MLALAVELNGGRLGNVTHALWAMQTLAGGAKAPKAFEYFHREIEGNNNFYTVESGQSYREVLGNSTLDVNNFLGLYEATPASAPDTRTDP